MIAMLPTYRAARRIGKAVVRGPKPSILVVKTYRIALPKIRVEQTRPATCEIFPNCCPPNVHFHID